MTINDVKVGQNGENSECAFFRLSYQIMIYVFCNRIKIFFD